MSITPDFKTRLDLLLKWDYSSPNHFESGMATCLEEIVGALNEFGSNLKDNFAMREACYTLKGKLNKITPNTKDRELIDRVTDAITELWPLPDLPRDIWTKEILPRTIKSSTPPRIPGVIQLSVNEGLDWASLVPNKEFKDMSEASLRVMLESDSTNFYLSGLKSSDQAVAFIIKHKLTKANLANLQIEDRHLNMLAENCPQLSHLKLINSNVNTIPLFPNLQTLSLINCRNLTEAGISSIRDMKLLTELFLEMNPKMKSLPFSSIAECKRLQKLSFGSIKNLSALPQLTSLTDLEELYLDHSTGLKDQDLQNLQSFKKLKLLSLNNCNLTNQSLEYVRPLTKLERLNLVCCGMITDITPLRELLELETLALSYGAMIASESFRILSELKKLKSLSLEHCHNLNTMAPLSHIQELEILNLSGCPVVNERELLFLEGLRKLKSLDLTGCDYLTNDGLAQIAEFSSLQHVKIPYCKKITSEGILHLKGLPNLRTLIFSKQTDAPDLRLTLEKENPELQMMLL